MTTMINNDVKQQITDEQAMEHVKGLLKYIGEDVDREGLIKTPYRVINAIAATLQLAASPSRRL